MKKYVNLLILVMMTILTFRCEMVVAKSINLNILAGQTSGSNGDCVVTDERCGSLFGDPTNPEHPAYYLNVAFKVIKYVAIILLIVMTVLDFIGAVTSSDDDAMNKALKKLGTRAILFVIIFVLPSILEFLLKYLYQQAASTCCIGSV